MPKLHDTTFGCESITEIDEDTISKVAPEFTNDKHSNVVGLIFTATNETSVGNSTPANDYHKCNDRTEPHNIMGKDTDAVGTHSSDDISHFEKH